MNRIGEQANQVVTELKRIAGGLQLTDEQTNRSLRFLIEARTQLAEYQSANPNATKADVIKQVAANRDQLRQRLVNFLSPEQLTKWDVEAGKAGEFFVEQMAA